MSATTAPTETTGIQAAPGVTLNVTESAAGEIKKFMAGEEGLPETAGLRVRVVPGGCSGFQYGMSFDERKPGDAEIESEGIAMIIDPTSLAYLEGTSIDFDDGLHGKGFELKNPNAQSTCGCGKSFN